MTASSIVIVLVSCFSRLIKISNMPYIWWYVYGLIVTLQGITRTVPPLSAIWILIDKRGHCGHRKPLTPHGASEFPGRSLSGLSMPVDLPSRSLDQIALMMTTSRNLARGLPSETTPRVGVSMYE